MCPEKLSELDGLSELSVPDLNNLCCDNNTRCARKAGVPAQVHARSKGVLLYIPYFSFFPQLRNVFLFSSLCELKNVKC